LSRIGSPSPNPCVSQDSTRWGGEVEDWLEVGPQHVRLAFCVVVNIARCQVFVQGQVTGGGGGLYAKTRHQILSADLPDEVHAQLHERESVALWLCQVCELFFKHRSLIIKDNKFLLNLLNKL
jgi:hypothetical protein